MPAVAAAYVDQLSRSGALDAARVSELHAALTATQAALANPGSAMERSELAKRLEALANGVASPVKDVGRSQERQAALASALKGLAARLR